MINGDVYSVLDVPEPIAGRVMALRQHFQDEFMLSLPVEITISGSSGVGPLEYDQELEEVFQQVNRIAQCNSPFPARFGEVLRFPGTDIFVFTLQDEAPFIQLHKQLVQSALHFQPSPYPFKPHCTIRRGIPVSEEEVAELMTLRMEEEFIIASLSLYLFREEKLSLLHRRHLGEVPSGVED